MATTYKTFLNNDSATSRTLLHEAIPVTGALTSGTYGEPGQAGSNVKLFSHGMFQSVYDYPFLSSSANHIFDITYGYSHQSDLSASSNNQHAKKINIYNQMAQVLMGHTSEGNIQQFDEDGDVLAGGNKISSAFFLNFSRLLSKDEIKKGSFRLEMGMSGTFNQNGSNFSDQRIAITDDGGANEFRVNSPAGEYGILYADSTLGSVLDNDAGGLAGQKVGLLFYQAGIAVISSSLFQSSLSGGILHQTTYGAGPSQAGITDGAKALQDAIALGPVAQGDGMRAFSTGSSIDAIATAFRQRIYDVSFNNTTELNSSIYFCRVNHNDFNYSANPTYLTASKMRVKSTQSDPPVTYPTTVGLYSADNALLAVAKLSEPLKKDPQTEFTLRVRLDY